MAAVAFSAGWRLAIAMSALALPAFGTGATGAIEVGIAVPGNIEGVPVAGGTVDVP